MLAVTTIDARAQLKTIAKPVKKDSTEKKESHWVFGATYLSNSVYLGRKDSVAVPYLTPSIGYHDKSGLFITGSISYLPGSGENRIDLSTIEAGYSHATDNFNIEVSAAKDFYSDASFAVTSAISGRLSAYLSYDFGFIEPSLDLGAEFSDNTDIGVGLGLGHSFSIIEDHFEVDPTLHANLATQNYYASYYSKRRYNPKRQSKTGNSINASLGNASSFQIMDYEFEAPFEYTIGKKLKLNFTPTLAIPVNPSTVTLMTTSGNRTITQTTTEDLSTTFYFSLGFSYTL
ncbi:hypothetical protein GCM10011511_51050 [Puia dinghuensis]|uniref:Uncharacterized protein n=2 Tax=Puia dinghuensis TaxID=1792502 RepID=A0A8J2XVU2_9BACT|nr:hypothetical protein GCM10011511_51050 [Puia dinghuensis]